MLVLVATDVDALCACKILQVSNYIDLHLVRCNLCCGVFMLLILWLSTIFAVVKFQKWHEKA